MRWLNNNQLTVPKVFLLYFEANFAAYKRTEPTVRSAVRVGLNNARTAAVAVRAPHLVTVRANCSNLVRLSMPGDADK